MNMLRRFSICLLSLGALLSTLPAAAQEWPNKPVRIVVPYPAGTGPDIVARLLAEKLGKQTHGVFVVDNKPGANAIIGSDAVAKAPADGSVLLLVDRLAFAVNPLLYKPLPYDARHDLASVSNIADVNLYLITTPQLGVSNFREFVAYAKAHPDGIAFGTGGNGSIMHLNMESIEGATGVELLHVPYKALAEVIPAMLGGSVSATAGGLEAVQQFVKDNKLRLLAIGAASRSPLTPDVPTIVEAGGTPDMLRSTSYSLHTRAGTPPAVIDRIQREVALALQDPELLASTSRRGLVARATTPQALDAQLDRDAVEIATLVRQRNITR